MKRGLILALMCVLLLVASFPNANAGSENSPEITDEEGDAIDNHYLTEGNAAHLDILAAWFTDKSDTTIRLTIKINSIPSSTDLEDGSDYAVRWYYGGDTEEFRWFAWLDKEDNGTEEWEYGKHADGSYDIQGACTGQVVHGTPAYIQIDIPKAGIGDVKAGDTLAAPEAITHRNERFAQEPGSYYGVDFTSAGEDYMLPTADTDGDGIPDSEDPDDDGDGMSDTWEEDNGFDPKDASDGDEDLDNDGLTNSQEYSYETDPKDNDTDDDTFLDGYEIEKSTNPKDSGSYPVEIEDDEDKGVIEENLPTMALIMIVVIVLLIILVIVLVKRAKG